MNFKTLSNKRILNGSIDFSDSTFRLNQNAKIIDVFEIIDGYQMRWDNVSYKFYGTVEHADGLRKFNGYENPFSVDIGDLIIIPDEEDLNKMYIFDKTNTTEKEYDNITKSAIEKDKNRIDFISKKKGKIPTKNTGETDIINNNDGSFTLAR